jgi:hypothetical protein
MPRTTVKLISWITYVDMVGNTKIIGAWPQQNTIFFCETDPAWLSSCATGEAYLCVDSTFHNIMSEEHIREWLRAEPQATPGKLRYTNLLRMVAGEAPDSSTPGKPPVCTCDRQVLAYGCPAARGEPPPGHG